MRIVSGIQPSGKLHLGNYYGALQQFLALQDEAESEALFFIADLHALTTVRDGSLRTLSRDVALDYLALGLDPDRATIWRQSDVTQHAELAWILGVVTPMALLERGHSYKDKLARGMAADAGLLFYPVLMAADILLYGADEVPVGPDQRQHLEMARDMCTKFNVAFVPGFRPQDPAGLAGGPRGILQPPAARTVAAAGLVPGTDGQKMSKSYRNTVALFGEEREVRRAIMGIVTDSAPVEAPKGEPAALLTLLCLMAQGAEAALLTASWRAGGTGYGAYQKRLVELFFAALGPARARRAQLAEDLGYVDAVLAAGAARARRLAAPVWNRVVEATGLGARLP